MWIKDLIIISIGIVSGIILFYRFPIIRSRKGEPSSNIKVSIIIPCRNEENNIAILLQDLKNQSYPIHEIICVNDQSEDNTRQVILDNGARVIDIVDRDRDWNGKPFALTQGAKAATGEVLIFLDADVTLNTHAIATLVDEFQEKGIISIQPYHKTIKHSESLAMFFNMIAVAGTGITLPKPKTVGMFGPVLVINREQYFQLGAHSAVKSSVIEDFDLGNYYQSKNIKYTLMIGNPDISFRMYPDSLKSQMQGFTKNFSKGALSSGLATIILTILWLISITAIPIAIITSALQRNYIFLTFSVIFYVISVLTIYNYTLNLGRFKKWLIIIYPIPLLWFHFIFIMSMIRKFFFKSVVWKGRKIKV